MNISLKLILDAAQFNSAVKSAVSSLGQQIDAVTNADKASENLDASTKAASESLKEEAKSADAAAQATEKLAEAQDKASKTSSKTSPEVKKTDAALKEQTKSTDRAQAAVNALDVAENAMQGNVKGLASATIGLSQAFKTLGISITAALSVALVAALAALVKSFSGMQSRARQLKLDLAFDNSANSANRLVESIKKINNELGRQTKLSRTLRGISGEGADIKKQTELQKSEYERQAKIGAMNRAFDANGADEKTRAAALANLNAEYDRRAAEIEHTPTIEARREVQTQIAENSAAISERNAQKDDLQSKITELANKVTEITGQVADKNSNFFESAWNKNTTNALNEDAKRYVEEGQKLAAEMQALNEEIKKLEDTNTALEAQMENVTAQEELSKATKSAVMETIDNNLAAELRALGENPEENDTETKTKIERIEPVQVQSDRLARIGGYVGGATPQKKTEDLLTEGNKLTKQLVDIMRSGNNTQARFA